MLTRRPHHYGNSLQVYKESLQPLTLYTSFHDLINVYSRRSGADNTRGQNFDVNRNLLSLSLKSDFIQFLFILYMYIAPGQGLKTPWGRNFDVNRNIVSLFVASLKKKNLWNPMLNICFMIKYMFIATGQGQTAPRGQKFYVKRKALSLYPFVASFKKISLKSDFIHFLSVFNTCI